MKKQLILGTVMMAMTGQLALGQAWFLFAATKNSVWDGFTTEGVSVPGGGHTVASFIWGPAGSVGLLGSTGTPTNGTAVSVPGWSEILNDPNFHLATNATSGALVTANVNASGVNIGGFGYGGGTTFTVAGTTGGATYTIYVIGWNNAFATPQAAAAAGSVVGWSNPFQYISGDGAVSTPLIFSTSGMHPFGINVPEPTTFALAGLGAAALLAFRRRR